MTELPDALHNEIQQLCAEGDVLAEDGSFEQAIALYNKAWSLIPAPPTHWEASTWVLAAIGDASFQGGLFGSGLGALQQALLCPGAIGNPFIHLRLGQCALEQGDLALAAEHLTRAYALEGADIFELDDPKYFAFLKTRIAPPASGTW